jgi:hypothetical protein
MENELSNLALKDGVLLFLGFLVGVPASMIASWFMGPFLTTFCGFHSVKCLNWLRRIFKNDEFYDQDWTQTWEVTSESFPPKNLSELKIYKFLHLISGDASQTTNSGAQYSFRIIGKISNSNIITGRWTDPSSAGYHGAFQMIISPTREQITGKWVGYSREGFIKTGDWIWKPKA